MAGDVCHCRRVPGRAGGGARRELPCSCGVSSGCVSGERSGAGLAHSDLAACPSAGCFDRSSGAIVIRVLLLEKREHVLGAVGGPGDLCPAVPHQGFFGALLVAAVCHGYPSVRLQVRQGRMMIPMSRSKI
jgi:hypothetical protein